MTALSVGWLEYRRPACPPAPTDDRPGRRCRCRQSPPTQKRTTENQPDPPHTQSLRPQLRGSRNRDPACTSRFERGLVDSNLVNKGRVVASRWVEPDECERVRPRPDGEWAGRVRRVTLSGRRE